MLRPRLRSFLSTAVRLMSTRQSSVRAQLAGLHQVLFHQGFTEGICNHLSSMSRENGQDVMLISPYGRLWNEVTASSLLSVSEDDVRAEKTDGVEISALTIHWTIHAARPDAHTVLHTHAPFATAMASLEDPTLIMCHQNCLRFFDDIAYDLDFGGVSADMDEGARIADRLGPQASVLVMQNHGVTVVGSSVAEAFDRLYYFERACKTYMLALASGRRLSDLSVMWSEERCYQLRNYTQDFEKKSAPMHLEAELRNLRERGSKFES